MTTTATPANIETARRVQVTPEADAVLIELYATIDGTEYRVLGIGLRKGHIELANRLGRAWTAKAFYKSLVLCPRHNPEDPTVTGFYACCNIAGDYPPMGRRLNADLKRLGF